MSNYRNREKNNAYMREYMKRRYYERKKKIEAYLGGKCKRCNSTESLQVDHVDPKKKSFGIGSSGGWNKPWSKLVVELDKCQLLCGDCHTIKTLSDLGRSPARGTHGTLSSYRYCSCRVCKDVKNAYVREWKRRKRQREKLVRAVGVEPTYS